MDQCGLISRQSGRFHSGVLNAITGMIEVILDEGQVSVTGSSWGGIKSMYH